jgi:plasmid stabilization system protein ParE
MAEFRLSPEAEAELDGIWLYLARASGSVEIANPHFSREVRICFSRVGLVWRLLVLA